MTRLLVLLALLGCGPAEFHHGVLCAPSSRPVYQDPVLYTLTDESACWGVTAWSGPHRIDLGWGDAYHADGPRTVVTYRGETVVVYPPPRRVRRAR